MRMNIYNTVNVLFEKGDGFTYRMMHDISIPFRMVRTNVDRKEYSLAFLQMFLLGALAVLTVWAMVSIILF
jgi:hypothetical protein